MRSDNEDTREKKLQLTSTLLRVYGVKLTKDMTEGMSVRELQNVFRICGDAKARYEAELTQKNTDENEKVLGPILRDGGA